MKKILLISLFTVIVVLVAISAYNYTLNSKLVKNIHKCREEIKIHKELVLYREEVTDWLLSQNIISSGLILENIPVINELGAEVYLNTLFDDQPKLVLRFSEINCMTCVDSSLVYIDKYKNIIGNENIVILASYERQQNISTFKRISKVSFEIFNTRGTALALSPEKANTPYFFVTDRSLTVQGVFIPDKTIPKLTEMYFRTVITRYFANKT